jgi:hypothetical protein
MSEGLKKALAKLGYDVEKLEEELKEIYEQVERDGISSIAE